MDDPDDRCSEEGDDGTLATEGCPDACGLCPEDESATTAPTQCTDSTEWGYKGKSSKDCDWVAKKVRSVV